MKKVVLSVLLSLGMVFSGAALACGGDSSGKHIGKVVDIDQGGSRFTIQDMESQSPVTFSATAELIEAVTNAGGSVMVTYEEEMDGSLKAVAVSL